MVWKRLGLLHTHTFQGPVFSVSYPGNIQESLNEWLTKMHLGPNEYNTEIKYTQITWSEAVGLADNFKYTHVDTIRNVFF